MLYHSLYARIWTYCTSKSNCMCPMANLTSYMHPMSNLTSSCLKDLKDSSFTSHSYTSTQIKKLHSQHSCQTKLQGIFRVFQPSSMKNK